MSLRRTLTRFLVSLAVSAVLCHAPTAASASDGASSTLSLSSDHLVLTAGHTQRFLVTASSADGFDRDVTAKATFASDHPDVVTVDAQGAAHAVTPGTATLTATLDDKT